MENIADYKNLVSQFVVSANEKEVENAIRKCLLRMIDILKNPILEKNITLINIPCHSVGSLVAEALNQEFNNDIYFIYWDSPVYNSHSEGDITINSDQFVRYFYKK